jgi:hypothetical protein
VFDSAIAIIANVILPYLILSLFAMLMVEFISQAVRRRARTLHACITKMLHNTDLADAVYAHPLVQGLYAGGRRPSYIRSRLFALALIDEVKRSGASSNLREAIGRLPQTRARQSLEAVTAGFVDQVHLAVIEDWYNDVMDQASGLYKWHTSLMLAAVATVLVIGLNLDAIRISNHVARRGLIANVIEARINTIVTDTALVARGTPINDLVNSSDFDALRFPIGWNPTGLPRSPNALFLHQVGWAISVLAVMLGAPFLFDTLNKFMIVRMTVKPRETMPSVDE